MEFWDSVSANISSQTACQFVIQQKQSVAGGSINSAYKITGDEGSYFVKCNRADLLGMFEAEAAGLHEIARTKTIFVPRPICSGIAENKSYIVLAFVEFSTRKSDVEKLGHHLAQMHQCTADKFGWSQNNTIGSTLQVNSQTDSWVSFWREQRLGFQLALAYENGFVSQLKDAGDQLLDRFAILFENYKPVASLLHGDLWSGNYAFDSSGCPLIFDPAVYYGDRETDIAMTELFGGFPAQFYQSYADVYPLDDNYPVRKALYNLYHILNHLNLFGSGYLGQSLDMIDRVLAEC